MLDVFICVHTYMHTQGVSILIFKMEMDTPCRCLSNTYGWGGRNQISWVGSFPRTKREVFSGTKMYLIRILSVIFDFSATFWHQIFEFWRRYFDFWRQNLEIMSFKVNGGWGEGVWGPPGGFVIGVGKKNSG